MVDTKKLEQVASRLNKKSDEINVILQKIQDKVNSYNVGLEVWERHSILSKEIPSDLGDRTLESYLGYAKFTEGWGFAVQVKEALYRRDPGGEWESVGSHPLSEPIQLLKASREVRIAALKSLPSLIENLQKNAETAINDVEKAKQLADEL